MLSPLTSYPTSPLLRTTSDGPQLFPAQPDIVVEEASGQDCHAYLSVESSKNRATSAHRMNMYISATCLARKSEAFHKEGPFGKRVSDRSGLNQLHMSQTGVPSAGAFGTEARLNSLKYSRQIVYSLDASPTHANEIGGKWVYRLQVDDHGDITRAKSWLIAFGYQKRESAVFFETTMATSSSVPV